LRQTRVQLGARISTHFFEPLANARYAGPSRGETIMGQPASRLTDMHTCPMVTGMVPHVGGPVVAPGAPTVLIGGLPAARVTDQCVCVGPPDIIVKGSGTVITQKMPQARIGDQTAHGGVLIVGCPTVIVGG
jgi:uncharacterized Zn-binding protein involved in type VI secretion